MSERLVLKPLNEQTLDDFLQYLRHLAAYDYILSNYHAQKILDVGCGTGYGSLLLKQKAEVYGTDIAAEAFLTINASHRGSGFVLADSLNLPFPDKTFDLVTSFQVIEHIINVDTYLEEIRRVLMPGGTAVISTPNRKLRLFPFEKPMNPYHVREYSVRSLKRSAKKYFSTTHIFGLHGSQEIMRLEKERLKVSRKWVYTNKLVSLIHLIPFRQPFFIIANMIKRHFFKMKYHNVSIFAGTDVHNAHLYNFSRDDYTLQDYKMSDQNIDKSLDLFAICKKDKITLP